MEPEAVFNLFDSCWYELNILYTTSTSSISTSSLENLQKNHQIKEESSEPKLARIQTKHTRSTSDQAITSFKHGHSLSPVSVLPLPKLQTIISGKEVTDDSESGNSASQMMMLMHHEVLSPEKNTTRSRRNKGRESKSLSDLEFEELKGFMDLGFVFSEEDKDSSLASIIPGLQRLGKKDEVVDNSDESVIPRPYLSEAWEVHAGRKIENPLMNWKVPAINNETDMKDSLRWWAHTVASTVR